MTWTSYFNTVPAQTLVAPGVEGNVIVVDRILGVGSGSATLATVFGLTDGIGGTYFRFSSGIAGAFDCKTPGQLVVAAGRSLTASVIANANPGGWSINWHYEPVTVRRPNALNWVNISGPPNPLGDTLVSAIPNRRIGIRKVFATGYGNATAAAEVALTSVNQLVQINGGITGFQNLDFDSGELVCPLDTGLLYATNNAVQSIVLNVGYEVLPP